MEPKEMAAGASDNRGPIFTLERVVVNPQVQEDQKGENAHSAGRWTVEEHRKFIEGKAACGIL